MYQKTFGGQLPRGVGRPVSRRTIVSGGVARIDSDANNQAILSRDLA